MPLTAKIGTTDSRPGNLVPGFGSARNIPVLTATTPASLVVEVAFPNNPIDLAGYRNTTLYDGPVSYWRMDNTTSLVDQAGSGNTMTVENTPTLVSTLISGDTNQATTFNGTTQDAYTPDTPSLDITPAISLELWVKFAAFPGSTKRVVGKLACYALEIRADGKLQFTVRNGMASTTIVSATTLSTGTAYLVSCTYDGGSVYMYLNGVVDAAVGYSGGVGVNSFPLVVARTDNSTTSPTYRGERHGGLGGPATSLTLGPPVVTVAGDYMLAVLRLPNLAGDIAAPAGWTFLGQSPGTGIDRVYAWGKFAAGTDVSGVGTYTWQFSGTTSAADLDIAAYAGVGAVPVGAVASNSGAVATSLSVSITPIFDNTLIAGYFGGKSDGAYTLTPGTTRFATSGYAFETLAVGASAAQTIEGSTVNLDGWKNVVAVELVGPIGPVSYTAATVDEVSVWNQALTATQVAAHYAAATVAPTVLTWTDISADVRQCTIARGRQYELDRIEAGTATLVVKDDQRKYDPANTLGVNAPNVVPLRQVRIRALLNGNYYPLFRGYVERWDSNWSPNHTQNYAETTISAVDAFEALSLAAPVGTVPAGISGTVINSLLSRANYPIDGRVLDVGAFNVQTITTLDGSNAVLGLLQSIAQSENGLFFIDASGNAVFHDKNRRTTNTLSTISQATFSDVPDGSLPYTALVPDEGKDHIVNDWHVSDAAQGDHNAADQASIQKYFRRTQQTSTFMSAGDAATMATYLLGRTKDPRYRFDSIELTPNTALEVWVQALSREISDRIIVRRQPVGKIPGSQIQKECWIERVEWQISYDQPWRIRWQLSPDPTITDVPALPPALFGPYGFGSYGTAVYGGG